MEDRRLHYPRRFRSCINPPHPESTHLTYTASFTHHWFVYHFPVGFMLNNHRYGSSSQSEIRQSSCSSSVITAIRQQWFKVGPQDVGGAGRGYARRTSSFSLFNTSLELVIYLFQYRQLFFSHLHFILPCSQLT